jgi:hypothetical protein
MMIDFALSCLRRLTTSGIDAVFSGKTSLRFGRRRYDPLKRREIRAKD